MPTTRHRRRQQSREPLEASMRAYLLTGSDAEAYAAADAAAPLGGLYQFLSLRMRYANFWAANRDELLAEWIDVYPGSRPWGWWRFDALDGRRMLAGTGRPVLDYGRDHVPSWREFLGLPVLRELDATDPPIFESEPATLRRLDGLTPAERRALMPVDFEPVRMIVLPGGAGAENALGYVPPDEIPDDNDEADDARVFDA
jgi:hypothetical protein